MEPTSLIYLPDGTVLDPVAVAAIHPSEGAYVYYRLHGDPVAHAVEAEHGEHAAEVRAYMVACKLSTAVVVKFDDADVGDPASRGLDLHREMADLLTTPRARSLVNPDGTLTSSGRYAPPEAFPKPEPSEVKRPAIFSVREAIAETDLPADMSSADAIRELWARLTRFSNSRFETPAKKIAEVACKTPGAKYQIAIGARVVRVEVQLPRSMGPANAEEAEALEEELHGATEAVLAKLWVEDRVEEARDESAPRGVDGGGE